MTYRARCAGRKPKKSEMDKDTQRWFRREQGIHDRWDVLTWPEFEGAIRPSHHQYRARSRTGPKARLNVERDEKVRFIQQNIHMENPDGTRIYPSWKTAEFLSSATLSEVSASYTLELRPISPETWQAEATPEQLAEEADYLASLHSRSHT